LQVGPGIQPKQGHDGVIGCIFIVLFICVGPFFVLNIVVGVIIEKFNQVSGRGILTDEQKQYKDTLMAVVTSDSSPIVTRPENVLRGFCYDIVTTPAFESCVMILIIANSVTMAIEYCGMSQGMIDILELINVVFVIIFTIELSLRLIAIELGVFFSDPWNIMDTVIVTGCLIILPLDGVIDSSMVQALRPFRLFLIFRMIKRAKGIKLMVSALLCSLPAMYNVAVLLFLTFFVFAVLGMTLFGNIKFGEYYNKDANFRNFGSSMLLLMRVVTGESWNMIMNDVGVEYPYCTNWNGAATNGWGSDYEQEDAYWTVSIANQLSTLYLMNDCGSRWGSVLYFVTFYLLCNYAVPSSVVSARCSLPCAFRS